MSVAAKGLFTDVSSYESNYYGTAVSEDAEKLSEIYKKVILGLSSSESVTCSIEEVLDTLLEEYSSGGWDGYGALPITKHVVEKARQFLTAIPRSVSQPEVDATPFGEISFEWYQDESHLFVVEINKIGDFSFAGLYGHKKINGKGYFGVGIPQEIINHVSSIKVS